mgnify:CR=1 FL=1
MLVGDFMTDKKNLTAKSAIRAKIAESIRGMRYGQIAIVIKNGKVVQIERTEKERFVGVEGKYGDGI